MDVFFYEAFAEEQAVLEQFLPDNLNAGFTWQTPQEARHHTPPAPIISIRTQSTVPYEWAPSLKAILSRSTGYDHIHRYWRHTGGLPAAGYLPLYCNRAVAEQALLLWLALLRKLPQQQEHFQNFHRDGLTGMECAGKHLLVVGVGNIGSEVVKISEGLDMQVRGVDIDPKFADVEYVPIAEGIRWADIIVCAMNLTESNHGYFNQVLLAQAQQGSVFINIARGELSPAADLLMLIEDGHLGGVGLDVFNHESELAVSLRNGFNSELPEIQALLKLVQYTNVIFTPHNAFNTTEAVTRKSDHSIQQVRQFLDTNTFLWPVPVPQHDERQI